MSNQLIEKIITSNNEACPPFTFKNPLLDRKVAAAVAKSFVKMLRLSRQNSSINNNLRLSILENIRRMCTTEPEGHLKIDENFTEVITKFYELQIKEQSSTDCVDGHDNVDKELDAFLIRKMKEMDITSAHGSNVNPEIIQSLINLSENGVHLDFLSRDIIHWNMRNNLFQYLIKDLWNGSNSSDVANAGDISIKMQKDIEIALLNSCHRVLTETDTTAEDIILTESALIDIVKHSADSAECFQLCSGILNFVAIILNWDTRILKFIQAFIKRVKDNFTMPSFAILYPMHLSSTVVLLDIDINNLPDGIREKYIEHGLEYLNKIHAESSIDFVLLLSHFGDWFNIYYSNRID